MKLTDHWLLEAERMETPNIGETFNAGLPDTIVIHFTGGRDAKSSAEWLCNPIANASAHVVIARDGSIIQLAPFNVATWHAGVSQWKNRTGINRYSIGIELDNAGRLEQRNEGYHTYYTWFKTKVPENEVIQAIHQNEKIPTYWQTFTEPQIASTLELCRLLIGNYWIEEIVGHEEISPGRKIDPGPAFPLDSLRDKLLGRRFAEDNRETRKQKKKGVVVASKLNIRSGPSTNFQTVSDPLQAGTIVSIEEEKEGWYRVKVETEGWVKKEYITY